MFWSCGNSKVTSENSPSTSKSISVSDKPIHVNKSEFLKNIFNYEKNKEWKFEGDLPCIVDFYADWCRPCKMIGPYMEDIAKEYQGI